MTENTTDQAAEQHDPETAPDAAFILMGAVDGQITIRSHITEHDLALALRDVAAALDSDEQLHTLSITEAELFAMANFIHSPASWHHYQAALAPVVERIDRMADDAINADRADRRA